MKSDSIVEAKPGPRKSGALLLVWIVAAGLWLLMVVLASGCVKYRAYDSAQAVRTIRAGEVAAFDGVLVPNGTWLEMRRAIQERVRQESGAPR